jgi:hypothetical protein
VRLNIKNLSAGHKNRKGFFQMKKNKTFIMGMLAMVLALSFVFVGCDNGTTSDNGLDKDGFQGTTVQLSGVTVTGAVEGKTFTHFVGMDHIMKAFSTYSLTAPSVVSGKLTFNLGTPTSLTATETNFLIETMGLTVNPSNAKLLFISSSATAASPSSGEYALIYSGTNSSCSYVYADKDVSISGTFQPPSGAPNIVDMRLKAGWNTVLGTYGGGSETLYSGKPDSGYSWSMFPYAAPVGD